MAKHGAPSGLWVGVWATVGTVYRLIEPVPGKFEFTYQDSAGRQRWQTANGDTKAERAEMLARLHRGERVERSSRTVGEVAEAWLERGTGTERLVGRDHSRTLRARRPVTGARRRRPDPPPDR
jgi:hypothetical protein